MDLDKIDVRWIDAERAFRRFSVDKAQGVIKTMVLKGPVFLGCYNSDLRSS